MILNDEISFKCGPHFAGIVFLHVNIPSLTLFFQTTMFHNSCSREVWWGCLGQFYADENHTKTSGEYVIKTLCLKTLLSHAHTRDISRIPKIGNEYVIKICCLGTSLSHFEQAGQRTHIKISDEYVIKNFD